jgi:hypothetical protein
MAQKRATVYILNVTESMSHYPENAFQKALDCITASLEDKVTMKFLLVLLVIHYVLDSVRTKNRFHLYSSCRNAQYRQRLCRPIGHTRSIPKHLDTLSFTANNLEYIATIDKNTTSIRFEYKSGW